MRHLRYLALMLIAAALLGCGAPARRSAPAVEAAPRAPDDQVVRGVGNLRRLLALPVVVEQVSCDWPEVARDLDEAAIRFLRDWKGYDIVRPADLDAAWTLARQVGAWQENDAGKGKPPADLRARLMVAAEAVEADGVLVIHAAPECPAGADAGLLTLPARLARSLNRTLSAAVYEAQRGTLIWQNQIRPAGWDPDRYGARPPPRFETRQAGEALFAPIENAVPAVLKTPPRSRKAPPEPAATVVVVTPAREPTALAPTPLAPAGGTASPPSAAGIPAEGTPSQPAPVAPEPPTVATPSAAVVPAPEPVAVPEAGAPPAAPSIPPAREPPTAPVAPVPAETAGATPPLPAPESGVPPPAAEPAAAPQPTEPQTLPPPPSGEPVPALPPPEAPAGPRPPEEPAAPVAPQTPPAPDAEPPPMRAPIRT